MGYLASLHPPSSTLSAGSRTSVVG